MAKATSTKYSGAFSQGVTRAKGAGEDTEGYNSNTPTPDLELAAKIAKIDPEPTPPAE